MGQLLQGSKSDIRPPLQSASIHPGIDTKVLGRAAIVHMARPGACRTFEEYSQQIFLPYITSQLETVSRVDIVWDRYLTSSLKQSTRDHRRHSGTVQNQRVIAGVPIAANWEAFPRCNAKNNELFCSLFQCIQACETGRKVIISTKDETIVSTQTDMNDVEYLQPCSHEEADTRILFHVAHCARQGLRKVVIRIMDTDVVALAIEHFSALRLEELWVSVGVGTHFRQIAIHEIVKKVNEKAVTFLHAINGCDTVSSFLGSGKKSSG